MIKGMNHVGISVSDLDRSIAFYKDMLGMELAGPIVAFAGPLFEQVMALENPQGRIGFLSNGSLQIELFEFHHPTPAPKDPNYSVADRGISHFCVEVTDLAATYERLLAAGVRFHCPVLKFPSGIQATYGRDPDGNVFELLELSHVAPVERRP
jgi:catechol 2,3-dioxygenase-like lactoylglutathione lyase family enzyme